MADRNASRTRTASLCTGMQILASGTGSGRLGASRLKYVAMRHLDAVRIEPRRWTEECVQNAVEDENRQTPRQKPRNCDRQYGGGICEIFPPSHNAQHGIAPP